MSHTWNLSGLEGNADARFESISAALCKRACAAAAAVLNVLLAQCPLCSMSTGLVQCCCCWHAAGQQLPCANLLKQLLRPSYSNEGAVLCPRLQWSAFACARFAVMLFCLVPAC